LNLSAGMLRAKLLNAVEHALIGDEITIEQYEAITTKLREAKDENLCLIPCDDEIYFLITDDNNTV
jgi:hypothetical protein